MSSLDTILSELYWNEKHNPPKEVEVKTGEESNPPDSKKLENTNTI